MNDKERVGYLLMVVPLIISLYFCFNITALVPEGYSLSGDGVLISRALMLSLSLYIETKLAQNIIERYKG